MRLLVELSITNELKMKLLPLPLTARKIGYQDDSPPDQDGALGLRGQVVRNPRKVLRMTRREPDLG